MNYDLIKALAKQKGLSVKELGDMAGMSDAGLYRAFINNTLKIETLEKISESLGVSPAYFFGGASNEKLKGLIDRGVIVNTTYYLKRLLIDNVDIIGHVLFDIWNNATKKEKEEYKNNQPQSEGIDFIDKEARLKFHVDFAINKPKYKEQVEEAIKFASKQFANSIMGDYGIEFLVEQKLLTSQDVVFDAINAFKECFQVSPLWNERILAAEIEAPIILKQLKR